MNSKIWTVNEAEAWNLAVSRSQTTRELGFLIWAFKHFANRDVKTVLDLACGTGRLAIEMAAKGYNVTGIDKFPATISKARANAENRSVKVRFIRTSLQELKLSGHFDAGYCVQALYYVLNEEELSLTLDKLKSLIQPGGILIIDTGNFISIFGKYKEVRTQNRHGRNWEMKRRITYNVDDVNMLFYHNESTKMKLDGKTRKWKETHVLRMWTFPELRRQLLDHGFSNLHLFGQQKAGVKEATTRAPRLVIVAKRTYQASSIAFKNRQ